MKTAQTLLGRSDARLTLDIHAQRVARLGALERPSCRTQEPGLR
jgi:hypothetical protein